MEDSSKSLDVRSSAATTLGTINKPEARDILIRNSTIQDKNLLLPIVVALSSYADERSLTTLLAIKKRVSGPVSSRAKSAASIISYHLGLDGNDIPVPKTFLRVSNKSKNIIAKQASPKEVTNCLLSIENIPYRIKLSKRPVFRLQFGNAIYLMLLNKKFSFWRAKETLLAKKAVLGVVVEKNEENDRYFVSYLILTSPSNSYRKVNVLICNILGEPCVRGTADIMDDHILFSLRSLAQAGMFPIKIEASIYPSRLRITSAKFSTTARIRDFPCETPRPKLLV